MRPDFFASPRDSRPPDLTCLSLGIFGGIAKKRNTSRRTKGHHFDSESSSAVWLQAVSVNSLVMDQVVGWEGASKSASQSLLLLA